MNSRFYQYHPMKENRINNLFNNQLYFNNPQNFKDPEDCKIYVYHEGTIKQWITHYKENHHLDEADIFKIIKKGIENGFFQYNDGLISCDSGYIDKNLPLVTCFCRDPYKVDMWHEYAEDHKGFCLCFKADLMYPSRSNKLYALTINSKKKPLIPVIYEVMLKTHLNLLDPDDVTKIGPRLITKNPELTNENECRILIYEGTDTQTNLKNYEKEELEGIIFGSDAVLKKEKEIYDGVRSIYKNTTFYKADYIKDDNIVKIKPIGEDYFKLLQ